MASLLDVNSLIALVDPNRVHHELMYVSFTRHHSETWATCALTENGFVRVLAQPSSPGGPFSPRQTTQILRTWKDNYASTDEMWADSISLTDDTLFRAEYIVVPNQVADAYLLGLAFRHAGRFVSFAADCRHRWFRQEYLCEFADNNETLFPEELIRKSLKYDIKPLFRR